MTIDPKKTETRFIYPNLMMANVQILGPFQCAKASNQNTFFGIGA
jgi:hypothetical protein